MGESLRTGDELLGSRILVRRVESGVDLGPSARKLVGDFQERLLVPPRLARHVDHECQASRHGSRVEL